MLSHKQTAAALAILAFAAGGPKSALANGAVLGSAVTAAQAFATRAYWTPERLAAAQPKDMATAAEFSPSAELAPSAGPTTIVVGAAASIPYDSAWAEELLRAG
jgi:hypothetical protein